MKDLVKKQKKLVSQKGQDK